MTGPISVEVSEIIAAEFSCLVFSGGRAKMQGFGLRLGEDDLGPPLEPAASAGARNVSDGAAVRFREGAADSQAEAGAAGRAGAGLVPAEEAVENARLVFGGDTGTVVLHHQGHGAFFLDDADADLNAGSAVQNGVLDQVPRYPQHGAFVRPNKGIGSGTRIGGTPFLSGARRVVACGCLRRLILAG